MHSCRMGGEVRQPPQRVAPVGVAEEIDHLLQPLTKCLGLALARIGKRPLHGLLGAVAALVLAVLAVKLGFGEWVK